MEYTHSLKTEKKLRPKLNRPDLYMLYLYLQLTVYTNYNLFIRVNTFVIN